MSATKSQARHPSWGDTAESVVAVIGAPPIYGPPVTFLLGPWLLLVLLLIPPFALVFMVALVLAVAAVVLAAAGAVLASPYLLVRHLRADRAGKAKPAAAPHAVRKPRTASGPLGSPLAKGVS
jgi:hypothetical protein